MPRKTTSAEFRRIPQPDRSALFLAMDRYGKESAIGFVVKSYGNGLYTIKDGGGSGRCLFFTIDEQDRTLLVALLGYKKESGEAPPHLVKTARERRGKYLESRRKGP